MYEVGAVEPLTLIPSPVELTQTLKKNVVPIVACPKCKKYPAEFIASVLMIKAV